MKLRSILPVLAMFLIAFAGGVLTQRQNIFPHDQISFLDAFLFRLSPVRKHILSPQQKARKEFFAIFIVKPTLS